MRTKQTIIKGWDQINIAVEAYVLASDPTEVFYPAGPLLKTIFYVIVAAFAVGAWIPLIIAVRESKIQKLAKK